MSHRLEQRLETLRTDFQAVAGYQFQHFFCPLLYVDEDAELCEGHIINRVFPHSDRSWTVQRKDVDNDFGLRFESDFVARHRADGLLAEEILADKELSRRFNARFLRDGEPVRHFPTNDRVPDDFSNVELDVDGNPMPLGLKISPDQLIASEDHHWQIAIDGDVKLASMVSLLKAAHLTMFHLFGYDYVLSNGGKFLGKGLLGNYYLMTKGLDRRSAMAMAKSHFGAVTKMVEKFIPGSTDLRGTLTDHRLNVCVDGDVLWAYQVFVRISDHVYVVMVPIFAGPDSTARFDMFLREPSSQINYRSARWYSGRIAIWPDSAVMEWPKWEF